jgi:hypothetical protein
VAAGAGRGGEVLKGDDLKLEILRRATVLDPNNEGFYAWDIERDFPTRRVRTSLNRLVDRGLLRAEQRANGALCIVKFYRTGKPLGPDQKLEVFVTVEVEA